MRASGVVSSTSMVTSLPSRPSDTSRSSAMRWISAASYATNVNCCGVTVPLTSSASRRRAERAWPGNAAGGDDQLLQPGLVSCGAIDLFGGLDQRLQQHLAVAPIIELILEDEVDRADRRRIGDLTRVVAVVGVRGDEVGDENAVDAHQLLDGH